MIFRPLFFAMFTVTFAIFMINGNCYATDEKILLQILSEIKEVKGELRQLDKRIDDLRQEMNARFEQVDKRFEQVDRRFEQVDKRFEQVDKRFDQVDRRFEQVDKRFEQVDKRFEQVDKRFEELMTYWGWIIAGLFGLVAVFVGLLLWDRRTAVRAAIKDSKGEFLQAVDKEYDVSLVQKLLEALRRKAKSDRELATILKHLNLL